VKPHPFGEPIKGNKMTSAIYASLASFLMIGLSINVIKKRRSNKVSMGHGGHKELKIAIAAQLNAVEYIPIALLLLFSLDFNKANILMLHILGLSLIIGRVIHAKGMLSSNLNMRVIGMHITIYTIISLAVINLAYIPYAQIFRF